MPQRAAAVAGVLHLGNLNFKDVDGGLEGTKASVDMATQEALNQAAQVLGIDPEKFAVSVIIRVLELPGGDTQVQNLNAGTDSTSPFTLIPSAFLFEPVSPPDAACMRLLCNAHRTSDSFS